MSEGKKVKAHHPGAEVLESGRIYFFYRPRVQLEECESYDDVQKMYFLLAPSPDKKDPRKAADNTTKRLFIMTKKRLPIVGKGRDVHWAFATVVSKDMNDIHEELDMYEYETKTRGHRTVAAARVAGEGLYELIRHDKGTTLAYVLELPQKRGPVQESLGIAEEAAIIVQVKNPNITTTREGEPAIGLKPSSKAHFDSTLQEVFKGVRVDQKRFAPVTNPRVLDFPHVELLMAAESDDLVYEFGELGLQLKQHEEADLAEAGKQLRGHLEDKALKELRMGGKAEHSTAPLKTGEFA